QRGATGAAPPAEGGPLPADELAVPAEQRLGAHREAPPLAAGQAATQRDQEQAIARPPACSLDLPPEDAHLLPERQEFDGLRPLGRWVDDDHEVEQDEEHGVDEREWHRARLPAPAQAGPSFRTPQSFFVDLPAGTPSFIERGKAWDLRARRCRSP